MQPGQQTTTRTEQRMDNDARIGNSIPAIGPMHGARQARTTACKAASRSALATGTLLLLLCLPSFAAAAQATAPRTLTAQPPPERAVAGNYIGEPGIPPEMLTSGFLTERTEEHTSEIQSLMRISYAVSCMQ